jgi:hypothetical protein
MSKFEPVIVPGWLGPLGFWIPQKGKAFTFGAFTVTTDEFIFSDESEVLLELSRSGTAVTWPRVYGGGGIGLEGGGLKRAVCFGRPFPDAPNPEPERFKEAMQSLDALGKGLDGTLGGLFADTGGQLIGLFNSIQDIRSGRAAGKRIRAAIEAPVRG